MKSDSDYKEMKEEMKEFAAGPDHVVNETVEYKPEDIR